MKERIFLVKLNKDAYGNMDDDMVRQLLVIEPEYSSVTETTKTHEAEQALLAVAIKRQCHCNGTGKYEGNCRFCGDSTYDHECVYPMYDCLDEMCLARRKLQEAWRAK